MIINVFDAHEEAHSLLIVVLSNFFWIHCFSIYLNDYIKIGNGEKLGYMSFQLLLIFISVRILKPNIRVYQMMFPRRHRY